jgi:antirestriction protein ArdC
MPISQVTSGTPLNGDFKPRGIIRMSALCVLCRYRHKTHWTSAESRCNRQLGKRFGDHAYSMEELVAELGAAFLCAETLLISVNFSMTAIEALFNCQIFSAAGFGMKIASRVQLPQSRELFLLAH